MTALAALPISCECGCREPVNPRLAAARILVSEGRTHAEAAAALGCSREYVSSLLRNPPRFIKGHAARLNVWVDAACVYCGRTFRSAGEYQSTCRAPDCQTRELLALHFTDKECSLIWDGILERRKREERERRRSRAQQAAQRASDRAEREAERDLLRSGLVSLDAPPPGSEDGGLIERIAAAYDPAQAVIEAERARELQALLGGLTEADVARLSEDTLRRLQDKIVAAGLYGRSDEPRHDKPRSGPLRAHEAAPALGGAEPIDRNYARAMTIARAKRRAQMKKRIRAGKRAAGAASTTPASHKPPVPNEEMEPCDECQPISP